MTSYSLKKHLLVSHNKVGIWASIFLLIAALVAVPLYFNAKSLMRSELPDVVEMNKLKHSISQLKYLLSSWSISGGEREKEAVHKLWKLDVDPILLEIEQCQDENFTAYGKASVLAEAKESFKALRANQKKIESCSNCVLGKDSHEFNVLYKESIVLAKRASELLSELVEDRVVKIESALAIIAACLILFFVISVVSIVFFNVYTFWVAKNTSEHYLSRLRRLIGATTFLSEGRSEFLQPEGRDEIAQLMHDFNVMQEAIFSREAELKLQCDDINQLIRVVTHDMKPPIINIKGHAKIIAESGDALLNVNGQGEGSTDNVNVVKKSIAYIEQSVLRLDELVAGILTHSKLSDKKIKLDTVLVRSVVEEVLSINQYRLSEVKINIFESSPEVFFDRFVVKFVVSTLIDNAIAYKSESRGLIVDIDYRKSDSAHEILIQDNGVGIKPDQINSLFKPSGEPSVSGGSGIGLATAKTLIKRLGGDIVYREHDKSIGSLFVVVLPL